MSPLKITYETNLEDMVEPAVRLYTRKRSYWVNKWRNMAMCAVGCAMLGLLGFKSQENVNLTVIVVIAGLWGALLIHFTYAGSVRRQIRRYMVGEVGASLPFTTEYVVDADKIVCTNRGVSVSFDLADLAEVIDDGRRLELAFGPKGLFVIPVRAFADEEEKAAFLAALGTDSAA